jgi:rhodanese-related sulfurtransferase
VTRASEPVYQKITAKEAHEMMLQSLDYILLDVRSEIEFKEERIDGAVLLPVPYDKIEIGAVADLLLRKEQLIIVYCQLGVRSEIASRALVELGYSNVYDMGGINEWTYGTVGNPPPQYWTGVATTSWWEVASNDSSFTITTPEQFAGIVVLVNGGRTDFSGKTITLANSINLAGKDWEMFIGSFQGVLDGGGNEISNMKMTSGYGDLGLFETLWPAATVKNLKLTNVDISLKPG